MAMKKFNEYTPEELREISRRGGIASGEARRRKKQLREFYKIIFTEVQKNAQNNHTNYTLNQIKKELAGYKRKRNGNK